MEDWTRLIYTFCTQRGEVDSDGDPMSGNEALRKSITLGSAMCSKADIQRRINLGYSAFNSYETAWSEKIPLHKH